MLTYRAVGFPQFLVKEDINEKNSCDFSFSFTHLYQSGTDEFGGV